MREPAFWWRSPGLSSSVLSPLGAIYGAITASRMAAPAHNAGIPVICVGNPTLGGAGKTPTAIAVSKILVEAGRRPFLLSRGYGGSLAGPVRVDPMRHGSANVGDEPLLLARAAPTIVSRDRVAGAKAARTSGASVVVMDDGFQNPSLRKDRSILVVDGRRGIGNGRVFPAGPLRAPLQSQLRRAQALLLIGEGPAGDHVATDAQAHGLPVFHARLVPDAPALAALKDKPVLAFTGIGDPQKFFGTLTKGGIDVRAAIAFADHHRYRPSEASDLIRRAEREGLAIVTTEKDQARLTGQDNVAALLDVAQVLPITIEVTEQKTFRDWVLG